MILKLGEQMDLKSFIKIAVTDIVEAITETSNELSREIYIAKPTDNKCIEFNIAVSAESSKDGKTKGNINVIEMLGFGHESNSNSKESSTSHIKFGIYINNQNLSEQTESRKKLTN